MDTYAKELKAYLDASQYTVAVTGAGISYMYGMRRFKQVAGEGSWSKKVTPKYIKSHPEEVYALFKDAFLDAIFEKGPSKVHYQMAEMEKRGLLQGIVTQNLDHLHTLAGSEHVVPFTGDFADTVCLDCGAAYHDIDVWNHGEMPRCPKCGGILIPVYFIRFGRGPGTKRASNKWMERARDMIAQAELLLFVGTTEFNSDEYLPKKTPGTKLVQINPGSTVFDREVDLNIRRDAEKVFDQILAEET